MPIQIFRLRGVPEDEADEIRALLENNNIEFYETPSDRWGVSMPAIWLKEATHFERAGSIIETYQSVRAEQARNRYEQSVRDGSQPTFFDLLINNPVRTFVFIASIVVVVLFITVPFFYF